MKERKGQMILAFLAAVCFFVVFLFHRNSMDFILACAWVCIGAGSYAKSSKEKKDRMS